MDIIFIMLAFILGIAVLIKASSMAVDLAVSFSKVTGIMKLSVGMVVMAAMTSLPELSIGIASSISGSSRIMIGNVIGASITDLLLVMGSVAAFYTIVVKKEDLVKAAEIMLVTTGLILYGVFYGFDLIFGLLSVIIFGLFSGRLIFTNMVHHNDTWEDITAGIIILAKLLIAVVVVLFSAELITIAAGRISEIFGIAETVIGATIISISTTMPELMITLSCARKKEYDILLGNIFGSCFVNIAFVMAIGSLICPFFFGFKEVLLFACLVFAYMITALFMLGKQLDRFQGMILMAFYAFYIIMILFV